MTAIWRSGLETNTFTNGLTEWTAGTLTQLSHDSTIKRSGSYALKCASGTSYVYSTTGWNVTGAVARAYIRLGGTPTAASRFLGIDNASATSFVQLKMRTDRKIELIHGVSTVIATSSVAIPTGDFEHYVECWVDIPTKLIAARIDGVEFVRRTVSSFVSGNIDRMYVGAWENLGTDLWVDDLAVNSIAGQYNCSWPGPSQGVLTYWPYDDIDLTPSTWTDQSGGTTNRYQKVDEVTPNDATDYMKETTGTNGAALGFYIPPNFPMRTPISCALFGVRGGGTDVTSRVAQLQFHDAADAITGGVSPNKEFNVNGWLTYYPMLTLEEALDGTRRPLNNGYLSPSAPGMWGAGSRSRVVIVRADAQVREIRISTIWMTVDTPLGLTANVVPLGVMSPAIMTTIDP